MKKPTKDIIMVFGTFDVIHKGHLNFFKQAKKLSKHPYLVVSVARDVNVLRIKNKRTHFNERDRVLQIKKLKIVDKVVLGGLKSYIPHIVKVKPKILALGYDQVVYTKNLKEILMNKGLLVKVVRLKPYKQKVYKSSLIKAGK